jgi:hypothetical protein
MVEAPGSAHDLMEAIDGLAPEEKPFPITSRQLLCWLTGSTREAKKPR